MSKVIENKKLDMVLECAFDDQEQWDESMAALKAIGIEIGPKLEIKRSINGHKDFIFSLDSRENAIEAIHVLYGEEDNSRDSDAFYLGEEA